MKPKSQYLFLGLTQQGRDTTVPDDEEDRFGPREDWTALWTPGWETKRKIVRSSDEPWQLTPMGKIKWLANRDMTVRLFGTDLFLQEIAAGSRTGKYWTMADEIFYVIQGSGYTLEWRVEADIEDRYYARVAKEPVRTEWTMGDLLYVPQNTIRQHFAADGTPVLWLNGQNRLFKVLGYDAVRFL